MARSGEIDAGGAFAALAREVGAVELSENHRQVNAWERDALAHLRDDDVGQAIAAYSDHERIHECGSITDARQAMVAAWLEERQAFSYRQSRMYAIRRDDIDALNLRARDALRDNGLLGPTAYRTASGREFSDREEVICLANDNRLGLVNGTRATVVGTSPDGLDLSTGDYRVTLPAAYIDAGHLDYAYASTIHKSQGATVDTAFVLASGTLYREAAYVAMSRARQESHLYVVPDSLGLSHEATANLSVESAHGRQVPTANLTLLQSMSKSRAKSLASGEIRETPHYLTATLGERPPAGLAGYKWDRAAAAIDAYRLTSGYCGPSALGPPPSNSVARVEHVSAMNAILDYQRHQERSSCLERSNDRGLSL